MQLVAQIVALQVAERMLLVLPLRVQHIFFVAESKKASTSFRSRIANKEGLDNTNNINLQLVSQSWGQVA